jgi:hypothetical protein
VDGRLRAEGVDCHRRGKDQRAREESGELSTDRNRRNNKSAVSRHTEEIGRFAIARARAKETTVANPPNTTSSGQRLLCSRLHHSRIRRDFPEMCDN